MVAKCYDSIKNDTQIIVKKNQAQSKHLKKSLKSPVSHSSTSTGNLSILQMHTASSCSTSRATSFFKLFFWLISSPNLVGLK